MRKIKPHDRHLIGGRRRGRGRREEGRREEEEEERVIEFHPFEQSQADEQRARLAAVRAERDPAAVESALSALGAAASSGANVMPAAIDAVEAYATVGEVCGTLRGVFGTFDEPIRF